MSKSAANKKFVLKNRMGEVIRTFRVEAPSFAVLYREDTGRIETHANPELLEEEGVEFSVLAEVSQAELAKSPVTVGRGATLSLVEDEDFENLAPRHELTEEEDRFTIMLKRTAIINVSLLLFCLLVNYFFPVVQPEPEPVVVTIEVPKPEVKPQPKPEPKVVKTVAPSKNKITPRKRPVKVAQKVVRKPKVVTHQVRPTSHGRSRSSTKVAKGGVNINQVGALAALGQVSNAPVTGGTLNLKNVTAKLGSGGGGTGRAGNGGLGGGKGGFASALGGKGLAAASRGGGGGVGLPSGGYGTRGRAGGQNGYGRTNLTGSGGGYFQPLEQDAEVEGGLDKDQINEVIQKNMGQILYCYEQGLQVKPALAGRVGVKFTIDSRGRVATAGVQNSSMRSGQVEGCIVAKLRAFRFPEPVGGVNVRVTYPFQFQRVSQR